MWTRRQDLNLRPPSLVLAALTPPARRKQALYPAELRREARRRTSACVGRRPFHGTAVGPHLFLDLPEIGFEVREPFHEARQVVLVADLALVGRAALDAPDKPDFLQLGDVALYLPRSELKPVGKPLLARIGLAATSHQ